MITNGKIQLYIIPRIAGWLILGILIGKMSYGVLPTWAWLVAMVGLLVAACFVKRPIANSVLLMVSVFCLGGVLVGIRLSELNRVFPSHAAIHRAVISSQPVERGKVIRCELLVIDEERPYKIQASILRDTLTGRYRHISVGDGIEFNSRIENYPNRQRVESNFNYFRWLRAQGVVRLHSDTAGKIFNLR